MDGAMVGTGVPPAARKLDYTKEFEWIPSPYVEIPEAVYRDLESAEQQAKRLANGFRLGTGPPELFDNTVRVQATNFTTAPDKKLAEMRLSSRLHHPRPFALSGYPVESRSDRGFVGRHRHFSNAYNPYEEYEGQHLKTSLPQGKGFRPSHRTGATGMPFRPTRTQDPLSGTDRNPRLHAVRAPDQMDRHDGAGARSQVWTR